MTLISNVDVSDASWLEVNDLTYPLNHSALYGWENCYFVL